MDTTKAVVVDSEGVKQTKTEEDIKHENEVLERLLREKGKKEDKMDIVMAQQKDRSVNIGVVGVGQCGSKIAEEFYGLGYPAVVINTAMQDLKFINIPDQKKLFLDYSLGGAGKSREAGEAAAQMYSNDISKHIENNLGACEILMLVASGGGGTGAGSASTIVNIMKGFGKPIVVLFVLPLSSEDALSKHNTIQTLAELAGLAQANVINSLMIVDNAKIECIYAGLGISEFWKVANKAIVEPLHLFNKLSASPSEYVSLDPTDFCALFVGTGDCGLYGMIELDNYDQEEAIAEAMVTTLETGLLSGNFDLAQTRSAGVIVAGNKEVLKQVKSAGLEYGFGMISKICNSSVRVFRGVYEMPFEDNKLHIYSMFSGLGLPAARVQELKDESERNMEALAQKEETRASNMVIDVGTKTSSSTNKMYDKIKNKNSAMNKLTNNKRVVDMRRK